MVDPRPTWLRLWSQMPAAALGCAFHCAIARPAMAQARELDPLLPSGIAIAVTGVGFGVAGATLLGPRGDGNGASGASLLGAALGSGIVGAVAAGVGTSEQVPPTGYRKSEARMIAGLSFTALGTGTAGAGLGLIAHDNQNLRGVALGLLAASTVPLGIGLPLLVTGARVPDAAERYEELASRDPRIPKKIKSHPMRIAGMVLTGAGILSVAAGGAAIVSRQDSVDSSERAKLIGASLAVAGFSAVGIGVPLWVVGSRDVAAEPAGSGFTTTGTGNARESAARELDYLSVASPVLFSASSPW